MADVTYNYVKAETGTRDGYNIISEDGANVSICAGGSFAWSNFAPNSRVDRDVRAGKDVRFRVAEWNGALGHTFERVSPSRVPQSIAD